MASTERVKLSGGPEWSTSWIWLEEDGSLCIEFYDYSEAAQDHIGNDIAYILTVSPTEASRILLHLLMERFDSYFTVQDWLTAGGFTFAKRVEDPA